MGAHEHIFPGKCMKGLYPDKKLNMSEATHHHWDEKPPNTYLLGLDPIYYVLNIGNTKISNLTIKLFNESPCDHSIITLDVTTLSMVSSYKFNVLQSARSQILLNHQGRTDNYIARMED